MPPPSDDGLRTSDASLVEQKFRELLARWFQGGGGSVPGTTVTTPRRVDQIIDLWRDAETWRCAPPERDSGEAPPRGGMKCHSCGSHWVGHNEIVELDAYVERRIEADRKLRSEAARRTGVEYRVPALPINEDDQRVVDGLVAKATAGLKTRKLASAEASTLRGLCDNLEERAEKAEAVVDAAREMIAYLDANKRVDDLTPSHWRHVATLRGYIAAVERAESRRERASTEDTTTKGETHGTVEHLDSRHGPAPQQGESARCEPARGEVRQGSEGGGSHDHGSDDHPRSGGQRGQHDSRGGGENLGAKHLGDVSGAAGSARPAGPNASKTSGGSTEALSGASQGEGHQSPAPADVDPEPARAPKAAGALLRACRVLVLGLPSADVPKLGLRPDALGALVQIAEIVHRDIKPEKDTPSSGKAPDWFAAALGRAQAQDIVVQAIEFCALLCEEEGRARLGAMDSVANLCADLAKRMRALPFTRKAGDT